jgi:hypothetical protein
VFDIYDDALIRFFGQLKWNGAPVPVVKGGADRAHSQAQQWLKKNRGVDRSKAVGATSIPYPFIAIWREPFTPDTALNNPSHYRIPLLPEEGIGVAVQKPQAVTSGVDVNIYTIDLAQANFLLFQLQSLFRLQKAWITIDFADSRWYQPPNNVFKFAQYLGQQKSRINYENVVDNSTVTQTTLDQKDIRHTVSCVLHGWLPYQPYSVPLVHQIRYEVYTEDGEPITVTVVEEK